MKFSIRDLFLVTVIVAISLGWFWNSRNAAQQAAAKVAALESQNERAKWETEMLTKEFYRLGATVETTDEGIVVWYKKPLRPQGNNRFIFIYSRRLPVSQAPAPNPPTL